MLLILAGFFDSEKLEVLDGEDMGNEVNSAIMASGSFAEKKNAAVMPTFFYRTTN